MRQAIIDAPGTVRVRDAAVPDPAPGEVQVASRAVGLCGSDLSALAGEHPFIDLPVVPGHEAAGVVSAVGDEVDGYAVGDRVLLEPNVVCGRCEHCASGRYNLCQRLQVIGCQTAGALAERFVAPATRLHAVPPGFDFTAAALVEPLATATHALRLVGGVAGARVAILGGGSIGTLVLRAGVADGPAAVVVTDPVAGKRERLLGQGADAALDPTTDRVVPAARDALGGRADVVFDCVSSGASLAQAIGMSAKGGTVVVVGVPHEPVQLDLPLVQDGEVRLQGTAMYVRADVERAMALIADGTADATQLVTASFGLEEVAGAFDAARSGEHVKVHVDLPA